MINNMNVFEYILNVFMGALLIGMLVYGIYGYLKIVSRVADKLFDEEDDWFIWHLITLLV